MQIDQRLSLFDYLSSPDKGKSALSNIASNSTSSTIENDIQTLSSPLADNAVNELLDRIESGDTNISLSTIGNLLEHNRSLLTADLQDVATKLNLPEDIRIERSQNGWQIELSENEQTNDALGRLQAYVDKSQAVQTKLNQVSQLSEMFEQGLTRNFANDLKSASTADDDIVAFLSETRQIIQGNSGFNLSAKGLFSDADGVAKTEYDKRTEAS